MKSMRIAVLRGGPSEEFGVSIKTGAAVLSSLQKQGYQPLDILITKQGEWLHQGMVRYPENLIPTIDIFFVALHGQYGEDGTVQRLLDRYNATYTGSTAYASHRAMHKAITKDFLRNHNIPMAPHMLVGQSARGNGHTVAGQISEAFGPEYVIKPVNSGSSHGTMMVQNSALLSSALEDALKIYPEVLVEKRIRGKEATVGVINDFREQPNYVLPPVEIVPSIKSDYFDYRAKYNGETLERCPGDFSPSVKQQLAQTAEQVHKALELSQYSRSDFMVDGSRIYFLEVNTLPGLTTESLFPKALAAVGATYDDFIIHLLTDALRRKGR